MRQVSEDLWERYIVFIISTLCLHVHSLHWPSMSNPCHLSFYLRMCLSVYPYIYLHCIYPYLSIYKYVCIYMYLSIHWFIHPSIHTFTCVCIVSIPVRLFFHAFINLSMDVHCSRGYCWKKVSGITVLHTYVRTYVRTYIHTH